MSNLGQTRPADGGTPPSPTARMPPHAMQRDERCADPAAPAEWRAQLPHRAGRSGHSARSVRCDSRAGLRIATARGTSLRQHTQQRKPGPAVACLPTPFPHQPPPYDTQRHLKSCHPRPVLPSHAGINLGPIIASVGGLGVVVGLASQRLLMNAASAIALVGGCARRRSVAFSLP